MADNFPAFPAVNWFCDFSGVGFPLLADSGKWQSVTLLFRSNSRGKFIPAVSYLLQKPN
jgi:hypothetical protein